MHQFLNVRTYRLGIHVDTSFFVICPSSSSPITVLLHQPTLPETLIKPNFAFSLRQRCSKYLLQSLLDLSP